MWLYDLEENNQSVASLFLHYLSLPKNSVRCNCKWNIKVTVSNDANTNTTPTQPLTVVSSSVVNNNTYSPRLVVEVQQGGHKLSGRKRKVLKRMLW